MKALSCLLACMLLAIALPALASQPVVGVVKNLEGTAFIQRDGKDLPASVDMRVHRQDTLKTGPKGSMGVTFKDETRLSLGPGSELKVDEFLFVPTENKLSLVTKMVKGTAAYVSGKIAKASPESVRFETPLSIIGIRGTYFLVKVDPPK